MIGRFLSTMLALLIAGLPFVASAAPLPGSAYPFVASSSISVDLDSHPKRAAATPAVLFVHWLRDAATTNMTEFAPEALVLAPSRRRDLDDQRDVVGTELVRQASRLTQQ
jgi:hypothetical protein